MLVTEIRRLSKMIWLPGSCRFRTTAVPPEGGRNQVMLDVETELPFLIFENPSLTSVGDAQGIFEREATTAELEAIRDALRDDPARVQEAKQRLAAARWAREVGGCQVIGGVIFPTNRESRADLAAELADAERIGSSYSNVLVIASQSIPVTLAVLQQVNAAVRQHVRDSFAWEDAQLARLQNGELDQVLAELDA